MGSRDLTEGNCDNEEKKKIEELDHKFMSLFYSFH